MGKLSHALNGEVEQTKTKVRELDRDGLVAWCKDQFAGGSLASDFYITAAANYLYRWHGEKREAIASELLELAPAKDDKRRPKKNAPSHVKGLKKQELIAWCREWLECNLIYLVRILIRDRHDEKQVQIIISLAQKDRNWHDALFATCRVFRAKGYAIPIPWREYVLDVVLGVAKAPKGKSGRPRPGTRNHVICQCIYFLEGVCPREEAFQIVSDSLGFKYAQHRVLAIEGVREVWDDRDNDIWP